MWVYGTKREHLWRRVIKAKYGNNFFFFFGGGVGGGGEFSFCGGSLWCKPLEIYMMGMVDLFPVSSI